MDDLNGDQSKRNELDNLLSSENHRICSFYEFTHGHVEFGGVDTLILQCDRPLSDLNGLESMIIALYLQECRVFQFYGQNSEHMHDLCDEVIFRCRDANVSLKSSNWDVVTMWGTDESLEEILEFVNIHRELSGLDKRVLLVLDE